MAIAFVQSAKGSVLLGAAGLGTAKGTFSSNSAAGNLITVAIGFDLGTSGTVNSVSDTPGNSYTRVGNGTIFGDLARIDMYYAQNITGGTNIVTVVGSLKAAAGMGFIAYEYSGVNTTSALDKSAYGSGISDVSTGLGTTGTTATTTTNDELLFVGFTHAATLGTLGSGWGSPGTILVENPWTVFVETKIVATTGAYAGTFSDETVTDYAGGIVTYAQAAASSSTIGYKTLMGVGL